MIRVHHTETFLSVVLSGEKKTFSEEAVYLSPDWVVKERTFLSRGEFFDQNYSQQFWCPFVLLAPGHLQPRFDLDRPVGFPGHPGQL